MLFSTVSYYYARVVPVIVPHVILSFSWNTPFLFENNPFTTGNPFWGTKLLGLTRGRGSGALKGSSVLITGGPLILQRSNSSTSFPYIAFCFPFLATSCCLFFHSLSFLVFGFLLSSILFLLIFSLLIFFN